ncbi:hypothetical protein D9619_012262 [Psilocybe cf. subviscida]|uniref:RRM domain-containing protein n=1 Tax=Psilocybe cf. subviscida TaxID=2480587 RepID=A0A8H5B7M2_9AGAR|nr:hypothetical protein D9619_012262 [Psilocybe cf. subviscida]
MTVLITTTAQQETGLVVLSGATEPTNTVAVTSVPKSFFDPLILSMLREHFASYGDINQWVPLQGFGRIIIVYEQEDSAEMAKLKSDPIVIDGHGGNDTILRVYRADPNPLVAHSEDSWIPQTSYLKPPAIEKNFLISPPGSPPIGWEQIKEDPPNATPLADDLIHALRKLQVYDERPSFEELTFDGSGVSVFVEDCDARESYEVSEDHWIYGETAPARDKWRTFATAMPPSIMS